MSENINFIQSQHLIVSKQKYRYSCVVYHTKIPYYIRVILCDIRAYILSTITGVSIWKRRNDDDEVITLLRTCISIDFVLNLKLNKWVLSLDGLSPLIFVCL